MTIKTRKATTPETITPATEQPQRTILTRAGRKPLANKVAAATPIDTADAVSDVAPPQAVAPAPQGAQAVGLEHPITGRGVFAVRAIGTAVSVEAAFLAEDGQVLRLPAVFPNRAYAQSQLEELWQLVNRYFDEQENAAKAGDNRA
jgi:hypothetical protein